MTWVGLMVSYLERRNHSTIRVFSQSYMVKAWKEARGVQVALASFGPCQLTAGY